ncbi:MAG: hypothetical protein FJX72_01990 [Armatimonadetes bacterium]|nr:hypothetical protein [Armatimonadota bacterium]
MRFRRDPGVADGALVRVILRAGTDSTPWSRRDVRFYGKTGSELVAAGTWAWCDFAGDEAGASDPIRPGERTVLTFNTRASGMGIGAPVPITLAGRQGTEVIELKRPDVRMEAVTFLGSKPGAAMDRAVVHIANDGSEPVTIRSLRFRQPADRNRHWALSGAPIAVRARTYPSDGRVDPGDTAILVADVRLEPTYVLVEVDLACRGTVRTLHGYLRAKREAFDISGGWVSGGPTRDGRTPLAHPEFVKTLAGLHVNTAHYTEVEGYSDQAGPDSLYVRYPLKRFGAMQPIERYDRDDMLGAIHGVEFIGEPQYGGGKPVAPQDVWRKLHPYAGTRLATTVTLSEEGLWRFYAGLSDFPHYDAYRVNAPAADAWRLYDRWDGERIAWGAPLETIGDMCRSLRDMTRPAPTAYWSQGPHHDWSSYGGRKRTTPTCDEIRLQAYHALASRITSLYWFNLSLKSLLLYPDTMSELRRVGREIRMIEDLYLRGSAYRYRQVAEGGRPSWDLASIVAPEAAALFALDLQYSPDRNEKVFVFGPPRGAVFEFELPRFLRAPKDVFRVDADGVHQVAFRQTARGVAITDRACKVAVYVAARSRTVRTAIARRHAELVERERSLGFDPIANPADLEALRRVQGP